MTLPILRDDALRSTPDGFEILISLPWIRSLPLGSLREVEVTVDGEPVDGVTATLERADDGAAEAWWFLQDRVALRGMPALAPGSHEVAVSFRLLIPYLPAGPDAPLALPFRAARALVLDAPPPVAPVARTIARPVAEASASPELPRTWTLAASAFNWTPEVIRAERAAPDIAVGIVRDGVAPVIELEPGQLWRSFPAPADDEVDALARDLEAAGGSVSIVGASLDDWADASHRRSEAERLAFLLPQLHAAHRVGAAGVRLPIGQAGEPLLRRLVPTLHDLDLVLYEEIQGQQVPGTPATDAAIDAIARIDDRRVRVLADLSMLMPALPPTYLAELESGGVPADLLAPLRSEWRDPATGEAVVRLLRSGGVPAAVHTLFMNLIVRFGRSDATDLRGILPLVGAVHLKFWDLDDADGRVLRPLREAGAELARSGFAGTLCSEWGGHDWLDDDPADMTRAHLALARSALAQGAASVPV